MCAKCKKAGLQPRALSQLDGEPRWHIALVALKDCRVQPDARLEQQDGLRVGLRQFEQICFCVEIINIGDAIAEQRLL